MNNADKFKKPKAVRSPDKNIKISTKINNIPNKNVSERVFSLITNKAKKRGNNRLKYDPNIASSPKKAEIL